MPTAVDQNRSPVNQSCSRPHRLRRRDVATTVPANPAGARVRPKSDGPATELIEELGVLLDRSRVASRVDGARAAKRAVRWGVLCPFQRPTGLADGLGLESAPGLL